MGPEGDAAGDALWSLPWRALSAKLLVRGWGGAPGRETGGQGGGSLARASRTHVGARYRRQLCSWGLRSTCHLAGRPLRPPLRSRVRPTPPNPAKEPDKSNMAETRPPASNPAPDCLPSVRASGDQPGHEHRPLRPELGCRCRKCGSRVPSQAAVTSHDCGRPQGWLAG